MALASAGLKILLHFLSGRRIKTPTEPFLSGHLFLLKSLCCHFLTFLTLARKKLNLYIVYVNPPTCPRHGLSSLLILRPV